ncbi:hypothetical protein Tco_1254179 [Tanacetum coccineum]
MSTNEQTHLIQPVSVMRNTLGKEQVPQDLGRPISDKALREYCDKNYHHILPIIAEKTSRHSDSGTLSSRRDLKERLGPRHARSMFESLEPRRSRSKSQRERGSERKTVFKRLEKDVFHRLGDNEKSVSAYSRDSRHRSYNSSRRDTESCYQSSRSRETEFALRNNITKEHPREE